MMLGFSSGEGEEVYLEDHKSMSTNLLLDCSRKLVSTLSGIGSNTFRCFRPGEDVVGWTDGGIEFGHYGVEGLG